MPHVNTLTTKAGLKLGPLVLETLLKHYFERIRSSGPAEGSTLLRQEELLYDEAFNVAKSFLEAASYHTVEEVQAFSNTKTPSPPWVHVVRLLVPMSCCDEAAGHLVELFGGEEKARQSVGGVQWWQVRGLNGVDAQWITSSDDWKEAKKRDKMREKAKELAGETDDNGVYEAEMDAMRCILYLHGGGYYFGSVDQERYSIQRHARKTKGRVFAINYRLSPQYPFPCPLQDALAAYLFLIRPPEGASHRPVKPSHIVIMGDSAGGGLSLALLQVIRDTSLPMPGGGVLISPWCDLTHSFPSIHTNTATDVIPPYGLSLQKPSPLWPPPSDELSTTVRTSLRQRLKSTLSPGHASAEKRAASPVPPNMPVDVGSTTGAPSVDFADQQTISLVGKDGEKLVIDHQVHLYTQNSQISHPLISPALSYLGGLPPLFFIASDKEVLRDEIIYTAHRAAYPERFAVREEIRKLYLPLDGIENKHEPTPVHLQVYDDCAHVLPVLFSFTTPAKYCYRAIASFCKYVTGIPLPASSSIVSSPSQPRFLMGRSKSALAVKASRRNSYDINAKQNGTEGQGVTKTKSIRRSMSVNITRVKSAFVNGRPMPRGVPAFTNGHAPIVDEPPVEPQETSKDDVAGPRFNARPSPSSSMGQAGAPPRTAGESVIYSESMEFPPMKTAMIRERVSTRGVIRPLEPENELDALKVPPEIIGVLSELAMRRYLAGKARFDKKFSGTIKTVEKHRKRNLSRAKRDAPTNVARLQTALRSDYEGSSPPRKQMMISKGLALTTNSWAWLLDGDEHPPPSSIVARRDTEEAIRLARFADQVVVGEHAFTANNLWSTVLSFLTASPEKGKSASASEEPSEQNSDRDSDKNSDKNTTPKSKSRFFRFTSSSPSPSRS